MTQPIKKASKTQKYTLFARMIAYKLSSYFEKTKGALYATTYGNILTQANYQNKKFVRSISASNTRIKFSIYRIDLSKKPSVNSLLKNLIVEVKTICSLETIPLDYVATAIAVPGHTTFHGTI